MTKAALRMLRLMDRAVTEWHIPVIGREKGRIVRRLLAKRKPRRGLEVGTLFGYSAILIGANLPRGGRLTCVEQNAYLAKFAEENVARAGLEARVKVVVGDALRVLPLLRGPVDFALIDAKKDEYLGYLRAIEPRLVKGAVVIADNTGVFRREVKDYLAHVRNGRYQTREVDLGFDAMEVSLFRG